MSQQNNQPETRKIRIIPYSFDTPVAANLITALDNELSEMYPDWEDLPHPGFQQAWVGGDVPPTGETKYTNPFPDLSSTTTTSDHHEEGRRRTQEAWESRDLPVLDALDADDGVTPPATKYLNSTTIGSDGGGGTHDNQRQQSPILPDLTTSQVSMLHFHVAFDVTDLTSPFRPPSPSSPASNQESIHAANGTPIGCIGLKLMPYFPHHRAHPTDSSLSPISTVRVAELKRIYIVPSCRGVRLISDRDHDDDKGSSGSGGGQRLPEALVKTAIEYGKEVLGVQKAVLETGFRQVAAVKCYERMGWRRMETEYGDYVGAGVGDGGVSICYEMDLA